MASNISVGPLPNLPLRFQVSQMRRPKNYAVSIKANVEEKRSSLSCRAARSEEVSDEESATVRTQLDLLEQLTSSTNSSPGYERDDNDDSRPTIREQLAQLSRGKDGDFTVRLGKKMKESMKNLNILTVSQKRNIKRQTYLSQVASRNDGAFFAKIGLFVILPPVIILAVAIQTGYIHLLP